ncbi:MAG: GGDEF domain-containing protein [Ruminococcus sp.]|nr:GGDEF domain-containing protein [Ruminococcus sp.]
MNTKENNQKNLVILIVCTIVSAIGFLMTGPFFTDSIRPLAGLLAQTSILAIVIMVITNKKRGFYTALGITAILFLMVLCMIIFAHNMAIFANLIIAVVTSILVCILYNYLKKNDDLHQELNQQYEQLMDTNRELERKDTMLRELAYKDQLTGLYNKAYFSEQMDEAIRQNVPFTVIYADMDNFKVVDDTFGPEVGDSVLVAYAQRFSAYCGKRYICARTSGDDFAMLLTGQQNQAEILNVVEQLRRTLGEPLNIQGQVLSITSSYGIASYPQDSRNAANLLNCSVMAVYRAKANGKDRPCFFSQT